MQPQAQPTSQHDLKDFLVDLEKRHPRDAEYITKLFLDFLLLRLVKKMPEDQLKKVVEHRNSNPQTVINILGEYCKTTDVCAQTIEEFKELLNK